MFQNRREAGERLASVMAPLAIGSPIIYALPRGGAPVAAPVALALKAPLDILFVRKIGAPWRPELALGAVVGAEPVLVERNEQILQSLDISEAEFQRLLSKELDEIARRRRRYALPPSQALAGRTAIVVDDGVATGATARVALRCVKSQFPQRLIFATPVGAADAVAEIAKIADEAICLSSPSNFGAVSEFYHEFGQVTDEEVLAAVASCAHAP